MDGITLIWQRILQLQHSSPYNIHNDCLRVTGIHEPSNGWWRINTITTSLIEQKLKSRVTQ